MLSEVEAQRHGGPGATSCVIQGCDTCLSPPASARYTSQHARTPPTRRQGRRHFNTKNPGQAQTELRLNSNYTTHTCKPSDPPLVDPAKEAIVPQIGQTVQHRQSALPLAPPLISLLCHTQKTHKESVDADHRAPIEVSQIQTVNDT